MSEAQIAIVVAGIGLLGAAVAAVAAVGSARVASRATLGQSDQQAQATRAHWLLQQRQQSYEELISSWEEWISAIQYWSNDDVPLLRQLDVNAMESASRQLTTRAVRVAVLGPDCVAEPAHKLARSAALFTAAERESRTAIAEFQQTGEEINLGQYRRLSEAAGDWNSRQQLYREVLIGVRRTLASSSPSETATA
ncbi:hypothetical protein OKJ48_32250 [Streptomyces kunmingensis]|uniref:Secreted protein n=1 Tax=Streptomyces kunmingensis TaxID=68225 RepID=A0ABU6CJK0_9ACTN|nr:hypothetical protein [Streptomyces kunmingensis]MEB3964867.1 hypothetical protein [Streptomyces kunmingensis]